MLKSFWFLAFSLMLSLSACQRLSFGGINPPQPLRTITLDPAEAILHVATEPGLNRLYPNAIRFSVKEKREGLIWESSDPGVAAVDPDGTVRAVAAGSVVLTVRWEGAAAATATVIVKAGGRADVVLH